MLKIDKMGAWDTVFEPNSVMSPGFPATAGEIHNSDTKHIHILPSNDLFPHVLSAQQCWCKPVLDEEDGVVVHNSADGREYYESGSRGFH